MAIMRLFRDLTGQKQLSYEVYVVLFHLFAYFLLSIVYFIFNFDSFHLAYFTSSIRHPWRRSLFLLPPPPLSCFAGLYIWALASGRQPQPALCQKERGTLETLRSGSLPKLVSRAKEGHVLLPSALGSRLARCPKARPKSSKPVRMKSGCPRKF